MAYNYSKSLTGNSKYGKKGKFETMKEYKQKVVEIDDVLRPITDKKTGQTRYETTKEMLERNYKKLAKMADQRLVRLEQLAKSDKKFESVLKYSYAGAMEGLKKYRTDPNESVSRFNRAKPKSTNALMGKINTMLEFVNSVTSTKTGIMRVYEKRAQTINQRYGTNFTWEDMYFWFKEQGIQHEESMYGSKDNLTLIGIFQKKPDLVLKEIMDSVNRKKEPKKDKNGNVIKDKNGDIEYENDLSESDEKLIKEYINANKKMSNNDIVKVLDIIKRYNIDLKKFITLNS